MTRSWLSSLSARTWALLAVVFVVWVVLMITASRSTLWDRDEARYATASLEMVDSGNLLYPTFNQELRPHKPVMIYWLMSVPIQVFGPSEVSVRLVSTLALAGVCFLTGLIAREFMASGPLAALIAGTSPMLMMTGSAATTDATLLLCILLAQWIFVRAWLQGPRPWHVPAMGVAFAAALLTKGPVGLLVPVLTISSALILARGRSEAGAFFGSLALAAGLGIFIFFAWGLPANAATGGEYWRIGIGERLGRRLFTAMEGHGGEGLLPFLLHLPYYPLVIFIGFLPWTMYLSLVPGTFQSSEKGDSESGWARSPKGLRALLIGMILPTLVLMTLVVSKLPHYIQPVFPWLAVLLVVAIAGIGKGARRKLFSGRMRWSLLLFGVPGFLAVLAIFLLPWVWAPAETFQASGTIMGLFLLGWLLLLAVQFWRGRIRSAVWTHGVGMLVFVLGGALFVLPVIESFAKPAQRLGNEILPQIPSGSEIAVFGWHEPSLHFYLGAASIQHLHELSALQEWMRRPGPRLLILNETAESGLSPEAEGFQILATQSGLDVVHGGTIRLSAYWRE